MATYPCKPGETCKKKVQSIYYIDFKKSFYANYHAKIS